MSSTCYIGISEDLLGTNEAKCIFCKFDGYLSGVGQTLIDFYNSEELAALLTARGNLESLGRTLEECDWYDENDEPIAVKFDSKNKEDQDDIFVMMDFRYVFDRKTKRWYEVEDTMYVSFPAYIPLEELLKNSLIEEDLT